MCECMFAGRPALAVKCKPASRYARMWLERLHVSTMFGCWTQDNSWSQFSTCSCLGGSKTGNWALRDLVWNCHNMDESRFKWKISCSKVNWFGHSLQHNPSNSTCLTEPLHALEGWSHRATVLESEEHARLSNYVYSICSVHSVRIKLNRNVQRCLDPKTILYQDWVVHVDTMMTAWVLHVIFHRTFLGIFHISLPHGPHSLTSKWLPNL